jgi:rubredoxin
MMKSLHLELPNFAAMSDDEVEQHMMTRSMDGRWSSQTRWLLAQFETDKLDLNEAWAQTWVDWQCPCCQRRKLEIARLTDKGVLLCQLDWHHDHLADAAGDVIRSKATVGVSDELLITRKRACAAALPLIERFAPVLLCNDCNAADAVMKARLGANVPRAFSFSPQEIARFITPTPHASHALDEEVGRKLWPGALAQFRERMAFAELMGERIGAGLHDRTVISFDDPARNFEDPRLLYRLASDAGGVRNRPDGIGEALLARSRSTAGRSITGKKRASAKIRIPTEDEFRALDEAQTAASPPWRNAGPDWRCPSCARSKFEILRLSNKGAWRAAIMLLNDYSRETDPESLRRRDRELNLPIVLSEHRQIGVCHDCRQIVTDAMSARPGTDQDSLRIADLADLVGEAQPHTRHSVEKDAIMAAIEANAAWSLAVKDFWVHREEANAIRFERWRLTRNGGVSPQAARRVLVPRLVAAGTLPADDPENWFDWMIAESERLSADA